jgi:hypothetical protein
MIPPPFSGLLPDLRDYSILADTLQQYCDIFYFVLGGSLLVNFPALGTVLLLTIDLASALVPHSLWVLMRASL